MQAEGLRDIVLRDAQGCTHVFEASAFYEALQRQDVKLFGFGVAEWLEMKRQYDLRGGSAEITVASIRAVFYGDA